MVFDFYYNALTAFFAPILSLHPAIGELFVAALITFIITLCYKFLVDQKKMKEIKDQVKEMQEKAKQIQKENPEKASEATGEMFKLTNKQMKMSMKPMIVSLLFVILIFPWLRTVFTGPIVMLPFEIFGRESLGWLLWYIIVSVPMSVLFRKAMGVVQ